MLFAKYRPFRPDLSVLRFKPSLADRCESISLWWRHNGRDSVSNHQPHDCLLNRLFRRRSKKTSKLRVTGLCASNSPGTGEFPAQMASNAKNVSIWWRHHVLSVVSVTWSTSQRVIGGIWYEIRKFIWLILPVNEYHYMRVFIAACGEYSRLSEVLCVFIYHNTSIYPCCGILTYQQYTLNKFIESKLL